MSFIVYHKYVHSWTIKPREVPMRTQFAAVFLVMFYLFASTALADTINDQEAKTLTEKRLCNNALELYSEDSSELLIHSGFIKDESQHRTVLFCAFGKGRQKHDIFIFNPDGVKLSKEKLDEIIRQANKKDVKFYRLVLVQTASDINELLNPK